MGKAATIARKRAANKTAKRKLASYRAKRDFERSAEPSGARVIAPAPRLRYVMQKHAARRLHYDLRLELDGVFRSWAITKGPSLDPKQKRLAVEVEDHPLDYGDFEGAIPKGQYGGGTVMLWDRGFWTPMDGLDPRAALKKGELKFALSGKKLKGEFVLVRMAARGDERRNWLLIKRSDAYAADGDTVSADARSIASNRTMEQIAAGVGRRPRPFMLRSARTQRARRVLK